MYDLEPVPEDEPVYRRPVCGEQNLDKSSMVFQTTSATDRMQPSLCRECYTLRKQAERQEDQRQKQREQDQADALKAHRQAIYRQIQHEAARLSTAPNDLSPGGDSRNKNDPP